MTGREVLDYIGNVPVDELRAIVGVLDEALEEREAHEHWMSIPERDREECGTCDCARMYHDGDGGECTMGAHGWSCDCKAFAAKQVSSNETKGKTE